MRVQTDIYLYEKQQISRIISIARFVTCIIIAMFLFGCNVNLNNLESTDPDSTITPVPIAVDTESTIISTATPTEIKQEPLNSSTAAELLESAVANLRNAKSFELSSHDIVSYKTFNDEGPGIVYGEFIRNFNVIQYPSLKVKEVNEYRYDPQGDYYSYERFLYQEDDKYYLLHIEDGAISNVGEVFPHDLEPLTGDVYQTLVNYSDYAVFISEIDGLAVYILDHPTWYKLSRGISFANLGFLTTQAEGEQLLREYVADAYKYVETIRFTIYVSIGDQLVTRVSVDPKDFMLSVWAEVERASVEAGMGISYMPLYEVMEECGTEHIFGEFDQIQDIKIP